MYLTIAGNPVIIVIIITLRCLGPQVKERPKSMLAAKSFEPTSDMAAVERWVTILAEELAERMVADNKLFNRRPKSLHLHYR